MENDGVAQPLAKAASAWALAGISSWTELASALAAIYTLLLIVEWCWKIAAARGWIKPRRKHGNDKP